MRSFQYEPIDLETLGFRLLRLCSGAQRDPIRCELFAAFLDEDYIPGYDALSYTWGGGAKPCTITVDGMSLAVTENLEQALQHLRLEKVDRIIWVDAVCINQYDDQEKGHQVSNMRRIYEAADRVVVWLGLATHETTVFMRWLKGLKRENTEKELQDPLHERQPFGDVWIDQTFELQLGLEILLARPWFKRVWILQEVANARSTQVLCGKESVSGNVFVFAPSLLGIKPESGCQAVLDIMSVSARRNSWWLGKRDLFTLLEKFSTSETTDFRDHIFALLSLSDDTSLSDHVKADYHQSVEEAVRTAIDYFLGVSTERLPLEDLLRLVSSPLKELELRRNQPWAMQCLLRIVTVETLDQFRRTEIFRAMDGRDGNYLMDLLKSASKNFGSDEYDCESYLYQSLASQRNVIKDHIRAWFADLNRQDCYVLRNELLNAISSGRSNSVRMLIRTKEMRAELWDSRLRESLIRAARVSEKRVEMSLALTERDQDDANAQDMGGQILLVWEFQEKPHRKEQADLTFARGIATANAQNEFKAGHLSASDAVSCEEYFKLTYGDDNGGREGADDQGRTALSRAAINRDQELGLMPWLEQKGVDMNARDKYGRSALSLAATAFFKTRNVQLLLTLPGMNAIAPDNNGRTALSWAVSSNDGRFVVEVLLRSPNQVIDALDKDGRTALSWAASDSRDQEVIRALLECKADVNLPDNNGRTALIWAASGTNWITNSELLYEYGGIDVNVQDKNGQTALWATLGHDIRADEIRWRRLLKRADTNLQDINGMTVLLEAMVRNLPNHVRNLLRSNGIDLTISDNLGRSAWSLAKALPKEATVAQLVLAHELAHGLEPTPKPREDLFYSW